MSEVKVKTVRTPQLEIAYEEEGRQTASCYPDAWFPMTFVFGMGRRQYCLRQATGY